MASPDFQISPPLARTVVTKVMSLLGRDVSVADSRGVLVASYDPSLAGDRMAGVAAAVKSEEVVELAGGQAVAFSIGYDGAPVAAVVIHAEPSKVAEFVPVTRSLVELLLAQEAGQGAAETLDQAVWQFFQSASDAEREKLVAEARLLGVDLAKPRFVVLIHRPGFSEDLARASDKSVPITRFKEKLGREVAAVFPGSHDNTITYFGHDQFLLLKDAGKGEETLDLFKQKSPQMFRNIGGNPTAGVGRLYLGVAGLLTSFTEAETALRLSLKLKKPGRAYLVDDLGLNVVFGDVGLERQVQLAKRLLAPLLKEPDLVKTLKAYFAANLNLTQAAKALHIHRNTLIYRLGKIKDLARLDPEEFEDAVQLKMALTLLDLE